MTEKGPEQFTEEKDVIFNMEDPLATIEACLNQFDYRRINEQSKEAYMTTPENSMYRRNTIHKILLFVETYLFKKFGDTSEIYKHFAEASLDIRESVAEDATFPTPYEAIEKTRQLLMDLREELTKQSN